MRAEFRTVSAVRKYTNAEAAAMFSCTVEQIRAQHAKNAAATLDDIEKAERLGKTKVRNYTLDELREQYARLVRMSLS
jgi:uncharacterized protein YqfB (UPF0267 family)